jgi:hypothetical protein
MKKRLFIILGGIMLALAPALPAVAATIMPLSPKEITVEKGEDFDITISVNPSEVENYTVKVELTYPKDLISVKSFSLASGWMPLSQPGYDLVDNQAGRLIKTAGYIGGFSSNKVFGTVSFFAKADGQGIISVSDNSQALDSQNQNIFSNSPVQVSIIKIESEPAKTEPPTPPVAPPSPPPPQQPPAPEPVPPPAPKIPQAPSIPAPAPKQGTVVEEKVETPPQAEQIQPQEDAGAIKPSAEQGQVKGEKVEGAPEQAKKLSQWQKLITLGTGNSTVGVMIVSIIIILLFLFGYRFGQKFKKSEE